jgi:hypothetical protein
MADAQILRTICLIHGRLHCRFVGAEKACNPGLAGVRFACFLPPT